MQTLEIKPTDTPKTDAVEEAWDHLCLPRIIWNHARELERENADLKAHANRVGDANDKLIAENDFLRLQIDHLIDANKRIADIYADTLDCVLKDKEV